MAITIKDSSKVKITRLNAYPSYKNGKLTYVEYSTGYDTPLVTGPASVAPEIEAGTIPAPQTLAEKPAITAAVSEPTTIKTSTGKTLVKTPTTGWQYEGGGQPTQREVIEASSQLTTQQKAARATYEASKPADVPKSKLVTELAERKEEILAEAEALRAERAELTSPADYSKVQSLMSQEVALRNESQILNSLLKGEERRPTAIKGTIPYNQYQNTMLVVKAWESLRPYVIGNPKTGNVNIDIVSALENGVDGYRRSSDKTVDQSRRVIAVENALRKIGLSEQAVRQGRLAWYAVNREIAKLAKEEKAKYEASTVLLKSGERIDKGMFWLGLDKEERAYLLENGIDAFNAWQIQLTTARAQALDNLSPYAKGDDTYDIAKYLRDHPGDTATLIASGFCQADIDAAIAYNNEPFVRKTPTEKYLNAIAAAGGENFAPAQLEKLFQAHPEIRQLGLEASKPPPGIRESPALSLAAFTTNFLSARGYDINSPYDVKSIELDRLKGLAEQEYIRLYGDKAYMETRGVENLSTFVFSPARALKPEVTAKEITPLEWAIGGAQIATLAFPFVGAGVRAALSGVAGGIFTYSTAANWSNMTPAERAIAIAIDAVVLMPLGQYAAGQIKLTTIKINVKAGYEMEPITGKLRPITQQKTVWRGLTVGGKLVAGKAPGGKLALGGKGAVPPTWEELVKPYEPGVSKIETNLMTSRRILEQMGVPEAEILKQKITLQLRDIMVGKKSPYLSKTLTPEAIKTLGADGVAAVIDEIAKAKIKGQMQMNYGSTTIKPQLAPELRGWRTPADIDIMTNMNLDDTANFARQLYNRLEPIVGKANIRINPQTPSLVETKVGGQWHHALDIHSYEQALGSQPATEGAYGKLFAEKAITVEYPGYGKVDIMRLSESGARKAASILEWTNIDGKPGFAPPSYRAIKDIADFYVIVRTLIDETTANQWAKLFNYSPEQLQIAAAEMPFETLSWNFTPSPSTAPVSPGIAPTISIALPAALSAAIKASPKASALLKQITSPVSPYTLATPTEKASAGIKVSEPVRVISPPSSSPTVSKPISVATSKPVSSSARTSSKPSPTKTSTRPSSSISAKPSPSPSPSVSPSPVSLSAVPSPSPSPSPSLSPSASPSPSPKLLPSPKPVPSPSPKPSPSPSPSPSPYPSPKPSPKPKRGISPSSVAITERKLTSYKGAVAWRQGQLKRHGKLEDVWHILKPPYKSEADHEVKIGKLPEGVTPVKGGARSAYESIQLYTGGVPPRKLKIDLGIVDIEIDKPTKVPGKMGAIKYTADTEQETYGDVTIGKGGKMRGIRGSTTEGLSKLPLHTTLGQLLTIEYKSEPLRQFAKEHSLPEKLRETGVEGVANLLLQLQEEGQLVSEPIVEQKGIGVASQQAGRPEPRTLGSSYEDTIAVIRSMLPTKDALKLDRLLSSARTTKLAKVRGYPKPTETTGRITTIRAKQTSKESKLRPTSVVSTWIGDVGEV